ncbi:MAG: hypothetical protein ACRC6B_12830, partial [Fusobacteriaceae bacterium]
MSTSYRNWLKNMILIVSLFLMGTVSIAQEINKSFIRDSVDGNLFIMQLSDKEDLKLAYDYDKQEIYGLKDNYLVRMKIGSEYGKYAFEVGETPIKNLPVIKNPQITFDSDDMWVKSPDGKVYKVDTDSNNLTGEAELIKGTAEKDSGAWGYSQNIKTGEEKVYYLRDNKVKYQVINNDVLSNSKQLFKLDQDFENVNSLFVKNGHLFFKVEKGGIIYKVGLLSEEQSSIPLKIEMGDKSIFELRKELGLTEDYIETQDEIDGGETSTEAGTNLSDNYPGVSNFLYYTNSSNREIRSFTEADLKKGFLIQDNLNGSINIIDYDLENVNVNPAVTLSLINSTDTYNAFGMNPKDNLIYG